MSEDEFNLERFVTAQKPVYDRVLDELKAGNKKTHWIWYVFPQFRGLGKSEIAKVYEITSAREAKAYLAHPLLGPRLLECTEMVLKHADKSLHVIFGSPDDMKFKSSMTLFEAVSQDAESVFSRAIEKMTGDRRDERTLAMLKE